MRVSIHQPHYLPWLPYFHKIACSDLFILLDDADYTKNGWQNRNKIKTAAGWSYLTVPVKASLHQPIREVEIARPDWGASHLGALRTNYSRAPHFAKHLPFFEEAYRLPWSRLAELNEQILMYCLDQLGIAIPVLRSSEMDVGGTATERLVALCRSAGATSYLSGRYAAETYLDPALFEAAGIGLELQSWTCPEYRQLFPKAGFLPDLSIVDLMFNEGSGALDVIRGGGACSEAGPQPIP